MTKDNIIRMAREAGIKNDCDGIWCNADQLEAFANLVAAAEREACLDAMMQSTAIAVDTAMALEREACAKLCEGRLQEGLNFEGCAAAIRARSQT